ncbi:hypothetical protein EDC14_100858 [Hydrogenispora ethanolica]|jgi:hypothetical protein|uniref:Uncharacterized protein n=1 Tax=Hydrogenispora ethanolica TaxID=1082276 RepID=A0A4R1RW55_HYDET|nr:hypothetical protein [Hydrogenispora ethanolica]TCL70913.1 hypothetical protein EDC14_100858 [Hydrogenispora ethanolica]
MGAYPAAKKTSVAVAPAAPVSPAYDGGWFCGLGLAFLLFLILVLLVVGFGFLGFW